MIPGAPRLAFGLMRLSSEGAPAEGEAVDLVHAALEGGVRWLDTADVYAPTAREVGHNERLAARALARWRGEASRITVATKGGLRRRGRQWLPDGRAKHLRAACEASLRALGVDTVDLYQLHAVDPKVSFLTSLRALAALHREGKIGAVGLCNVRRSEMERAREIVPIASVQVSLSPLELGPLKNGVAELCAEEGIPLLAHSPLGGHRNRGKLPRHGPLSDLARELDVTVFELALAWLLSLHPTVVPVFGATRMDSVASSLRAARLELPAEALRELDEILPASRAARSPRAMRRDTATGRGEVVLFVGYPAAGKTTASEAWIARGYVRLNRDERGGRLADLIPELDERLGRGERFVVMDNTYPERAARFDVVETAWKHGVPVRCVWLASSLEQSQVNAVERMVARHGRLLSPDEIRAESRQDPNTFPPEAQFRYRRALEEPRLDEGFTAIDVVTPRFDRDRGNGRAVFFEYEGVLRRTKSGAPHPLGPDDVEVLPGRGETLRRYREDDHVLLGVSYQPWIGSGRITEAAAREAFAATHELLGLGAGGGPEIDVELCPHEPGPAVCWCRKPLPGLGVLLAHRHRLDLSRCLVVASSAADRAFAARLGCRAVPVGEFFGD